MCIIVDTNSLASVFDRSAVDHSDFEPVLDWIINGKGKLIFGGSKYISELKKSPKYLTVINRLKNMANKVIVVNCKLVDSTEENIRKQVSDPDFDDPHLPAIVIVSQCMLICSKDTRSVRFVTMPELYPRGVDVPKYYTGIQNKNLLCDKYIHKKYKPLTKCNKREKERIGNLL